jgi:hypothetical protein
MANNLTRDDFKAGKRLFRGTIREEFYFEGTTIFKLSSGEFFYRLDHHILPIVGFFPEIEVYRLQNGKLVLVYLMNLKYTYIEAIKVLESKMTEPFDGFRPDRLFILENGQIWQQITLTHTSSSSQGYVKIIRDDKIIVDGWDFSPRVKLTNGKRL